MWAFLAVRSLFFARLGMRHVWIEIDVLRPPSCRDGHIGPTLAHLADHEDCAIRDVV
jgi:hypothetical protein